MAVKKSNQPEEERRESGEEPRMRRPFDDEVQDPYVPNDEGLRDPWENPGDDSPVEPADEPVEPAPNPVPVPEPVDDDKKPKPPKKDK